MSAAARRLYDWLDRRLPLSTARDAALQKTVPVHRFSVVYYFGGMTLFFFLVQVVTGILLMLYYRPGAEEAFESVEFIMTTVPFGWLVRSIHSWSANLMVFFAFVHLATVYFTKGYRRPREITWITGVLLFFLTLAFGFSGYLLPWNQLAFFATKVGTEIAGAVPLVGEWTVRFLRGGDRVTGATLSRFFGWHVAILPALTLLLLGLHLLLVQLQGLSVPPAREEEARRRQPMRFVPHFALRDLFGWLLALAVLASLAALFPWELGEKADPFAPAYADIKPEWYFMFMFQTLKLVPGGSLLGVEYEAIPILLFGLAGLALLAVPFLDRKAQQGRPSPLFSVIGVAACVYVVALTAWGYHSWLPVWVVLATGAFIALMAWVVRHGGAGGTSAPVLALALLLTSLFAGPAPAQPVATSCTECHGHPDWIAQEDLEIVRTFEQDAHADAGLSCHDCHGGDPDPALADDMAAAMDPERGYRGVPGPTAVPAFCGRCHSDPVYMRRFQPDARVDQEREYATSRHGELLARGDTAVATCVDCHGVHPLLAPEDAASPVHPRNVAETCRGCHADPALMAGRTLPDGRPVPVDQYARWRRSVHATALHDKEDLSAPTCNDCHGNHGALPPGLESIAFVCGQCHGREAELFRASGKRRGYRDHNEFLASVGGDGAGADCSACHDPDQVQARSVPVQEFTECSTCHRNHGIVRPTVAMLSPLPRVPCALCHGTVLGEDGPGDGEAGGLVTPEPQEIRRNYRDVRDALLADAATEGVEGEALFDWMVDRALELPQHTAAGGDGGGDGAPPLRPEFERLFDKFRIGKTYFTYPDPVSGEPVRAPVVRCNDCHSAEPDLAAAATGLDTARTFLDHMTEVTTLTARAERMLLAARRGGVEVREPATAIDRAVDAQIELEVLVHTFQSGEDGAFHEKYTAGREHATDALEGARRALDELAFRRRGLAVSLLLIALVLVGLGLKIRQLSG